MSPLAPLGAIRRRTTTLALLLAMVAAALVGPSVVSPAHRLGLGGGLQLLHHESLRRRPHRPLGVVREGFPTSRGWYSWSGGSPTSPAASSTTTRVNCPPTPPTTSTTSTRVRRVPPGRVPDRGEPQHRGHLVLAQPLHRLLPALTDLGA
ncbi:hypothetical protein NKG94_11155 [Micromonospora sp. M12]